MEISVIIPVYNGEKFLERIIADLNNQSYKNFEAIFVDDGSVDDSCSFIQSRIDSGCGFTAKIIRQENRGVSAARNAGMESAEGNYFCFVDADDGIRPGYLADMFSVIEQEKADVVFCKTTDQKIYAGKEYCVLAKGEALEKYLFRGFTSGVCTMMVRSGIIKQNGLVFAEGYKYSEDLHMVWRILEYSGKVILLEKQLYIYLKNQGSAMTRFDESRFDSVHLFKDLEDFFLENNRAFFPLFKKYAVAHKEWSLLWQAALHLPWTEFSKLTKDYEFNTGLKELSSYPVKYVKLSSKVFLISKRLFFICVKLFVRKETFGMQRYCL